MSRVARFDASPTSLIRARRLAKPNRIKRLPKPLKPVFPHTAERQYTKDILRYVRRAHELTKQLLYPALSSILFEMKSALPKRTRADDAVDDLASIIAKIRDGLRREFTDADLQFIADNMGTSVDQVARANARRLFDQYGKYGLDLTIRFNSNATRAMLSLKVKENVQLIKTMADRHFASLGLRSINAFFPHHQSIPVSEYDVKYLVPIRAFMLQGGGFILDLLCIVSVCAFDRGHEHSQKHECHPLRCPRCRADSRRSSL